MGLSWPWKSLTEVTYGYRRGELYGIGVGSGCDKTAIKERMDDLTERRESKQPLEFASAGSTFKRPPGYFAGTLIEQTGLKGLSVGDAQVSEKHAGFVINTGNASANDVLNLIAEVQRRVYDEHGVHLEPEVRMIGEDE